MERERRRSGEEMPLLLQQGVVAVHLRIRLLHQRIIEGRLVHDARPSHRPRRLHRRLADVLQPQQRRLLVLRGVRDAKGPTVVVPDVALASLRSLHHALTSGRQGHTHIAHHRRTLGVGSDPRRILAIHPALRRSSCRKAGRHLIPGARRRLRRRILQHPQPEAQRLLRQVAVHPAAILHRRLPVLHIDAPVVQPKAGRYRLEELIRRRRMPRCALHRRAPQIQTLLLTVRSEELGVVGILLKRRRRRQIVPVLRLERRLNLRILEQILPIEVDLHERLHRHTVHVTCLRILEGVDEGGEVVEIELGSHQPRVVLQHLRQVDQEVAGQVGVDDVLLDVDEVIDARGGLHVFDRLVVHLIPGRHLELHLDPRLLLELLRQHVAHVLRRRRALRNTPDRHASVGLRRFRPPAHLFLRRRGKCGRWLDRRTLNDEHASDHKQSQNRPQFGFHCVFLLSVAVGLVWESQREAYSTVLIGHYHPLSRSVETRKFSECLTHRLAVMITFWQRWGALEHMPVTLMDIISLILTFVKFVIGQQQFSIWRSSGQKHVTASPGCQAIAP